MKLVQMGNKQLRVEDDRLEDMLRDGYVEVDMRTGKPVTAKQEDDVLRRNKRQKPGIEP